MKKVLGILLIVFAMLVLGTCEEEPPDEPPYQPPITLFVFNNGIKRYWRSNFFELNEFYSDTLSDFDTYKIELSGTVDVDLVKFQVEIFGEGDEYLTSIGKITPEETIFLLVTSIKLLH